MCEEVQKEENINVPGCSDMIGCGRMIGPES